MSTSGIGNLSFGMAWYIGGTIGCGVGAAFDTGATTSSRGVATQPEMSIVPSPTMKERRPTFASRIPVACLAAMVSKSRVIRRTSLVSMTLRNLSTLRLP